MQTSRQHHSAKTSTTNGNKRVTEGAHARQNTHENATQGFPAKTADFTAQKQSASASSNDKPVCANH
jgi:hypothetical protein